MENSFNMNEESNQKGEEIGKQTEENKKYGIKKLVKLMLLKSTSKINTKKTVLLDLNPSSLQTLVKIDFTLSNTFLLYSNGQVYSKGKGEALGRKREEKVKLGEVIFNPGDNFNANSSLNSSKLVIYNISAGDNHVLALDNMCNVWGWGENKYHQVLPKSDIKLIESPNIISINPPVIVSQIFAYKTSSFALCQKNQIISWGSINSKGNGRVKTKKEGELVTEFLKYDQLTSFISEQMFKDTSDYTDAFINTRKLLNSKYAVGMKQDDAYKEREKVLQMKKKQLLADIEIRQKETKQFGLSLTDKHNDRRITILQELIKIYEKKITKIASQKEKLSKDLSRIDEELTEENSDLKNNKALIDKVETDIENIYNDITTYESKNQNMSDQVPNNQKENQNDRSEIMSSVNNTPSVKESIHGNEYSIGEMQKKIRNMEIFKESLNKNLQLISSSIDLKEKEHSLISNAINKISDKENDYLQARYTIEDMIQVLIQSKKIKGRDNVNDHQPKTNSNSNILFEKSKDINKHILFLNEKTEKFAFVYLNMLFPYKMTEDLLSQSNKELDLIKEELEKIITPQTETIKNDIKVISELLQSRLQLIRQQNQMISMIYALFSSLKESDVRMYYQDKTKAKEASGLYSGRNDYKDNIEYVYKDIIIKLLKETYWITKEEEKSEERDEEIVEREKEKYLSEKIETNKKLKERSYIGVVTRQEERLLEDVVSYDNCNQIDVLKSSWTWDSTLNNMSSTFNTLKSNIMSMTSSTSTPNPSFNPTNITLTPNGSTTTPGSSWKWQTPFTFK